MVKSGRPYVPIDTALPDERIQHILAIAKPTLVLTPQETIKLSEPGKSTPPLRLQGDDPFYIIFTSGSTGMPKGIIITLNCLEHFIGWMLREQEFIERGEVFLNQAPFSFDVSAMDLDSAWPLAARFSALAETCSPARNCSIRRWRIPILPRGSPRPHLWRCVSSSVRLIERCCNACAAFSYPAKSCCRLRFACCSIDFRAPRFVNWTDRPR